MNVLDPIARVAEMCFGLFMALTFVGAVSALGGTDSPRAMFAAALGCNLAWGLVDAVMYLVSTLVERGRRLTALALRDDPDRAKALGAMRAVLPEGLHAVLSDAEIAAIGSRLAASGQLPTRPRLDRRDFAGALGIFLIVVASTFPVALPFLVFSDAQLALHVSRGLTIAMLFVGGIALGRYSGYGGWKAGLGMVGVGLVLVGAIIALGG